MALINRPTQVALHLGKFFGAIREGTAPDKFTQQYLKDMGFGGSNYRVLIPLLKDLGFLTSEGVPTERYRNYLDGFQSKKILGSAVREAYSDIFTITKNPTKADKDKISGKFKSTFNHSDIQADRNASTFLALVDLSEFGEEPTITAKTENSPEPGVEPSYATNAMGGTRVIGLKYDIAIHLPATKDIEVYNAIFKSLKEHLVD